MITDPNHLGAASSIRGQPREKEIGDPNEAEFGDEIGIRYTIECLCLIKVYCNS